MSETEIRTNGSAVVECVYCGEAWQKILPPTCPKCALGGPWTSHGHPIPGVTVVGAGRPPVARCGGPRLCKKCAVEAEQIRDAADQ